MTKRPNVLLITSDQQHWNTLGCLNPEIRTPALDALAQNGTLFTRAYCPNPTCTPTRASIITGRYPSQHGAWSLGTKLPENESTVNTLFTDAGYRTALIGKAHFQPLSTTEEYKSLEAYPVLQDLDFWRGFNGPFYGFDHIEIARNHTDEAHVGQHYALWMEQQGFKNWRDFFLPPTGTASKNQFRTWDIPEEYHYNTWIAERTNAVMETFAENRENFFLWASFFDPHPKYLVPKPWDRMYDPEKLTVPDITEGEHENNPIHIRMTQEERPDFSSWKEPDGNSMHGFHSHLRDRNELAKDIAIYYGMVSCMDKYIGVILDKLDELGLRENTLVVFTTDHGHFYGQHGLIAKGPFHYEDMIRIPFIVSMPGQVPSDQRSSALQSLIDLPQTFLSVCGLKDPGDMTGVNQMDVWFGNRNAERDHIIVENHHQPTTIHVKTYVDEQYKITVYCNREYGELYDLIADPKEKLNLWNDPNAKELKKELIEKLLLSEIAKEEPLTAKTLLLPQKSEAMYIKTMTANNHEITVNPEAERFELYNLETDPDRRNNLWNASEAGDSRSAMVRALLFKRMENEPLWMPRIRGA